MGNEGRAADSGTGGAGAAATVRLSAEPATDGATEAARRRSPSSSLPPRKLTVRDLCPSAEAASGAPRAGEAEAGEALGDAAGRGRGDESALVPRSAAGRCPSVPAVAMMPATRTSSMMLQPPQHSLQRTSAASGTRVRRRCSQWTSTEESGCGDDCGTGVGAGSTSLTLRRQRGASCPRSAPPFHPPFRQRRAGRSAVCPPLQPGQLGRGWLLLQPQPQQQPLRLRETPWSP